MGSIDNLSSTIRRVVTTHSDDGKAVLWKDDEISATPVSTRDGSSARFAHIWTTDEFPYDNADSRDLALDETGKKLSNENGVILRVVDLPPHSNSPFHRTQSLDYGIVLEGECVLVLDDGKEIEMKKGDVCVQRGTIHGWKNNTDSWGRIYFVLMASKPLTRGGKKLGDAGYELD